MKKTGAEIIIDSLLNEGVDTLFGYPGGVIIPIFDVLYSTPKIKMILTRHEQGAAHAADGYARATGKVGVCLATSGPGATNLVTGLATAYLDSIPVVAITGQVSTQILGTDAFQEADVVGITRPITKHNILVKNVEELPRALKMAFHIASTGRPGPVLIDIPKDISVGTVENYSYPKSVSIRGYKPNVEGNARQIQKAAEAIMQAERPLLYAGGGVVLSGAHKELLDLAEKTNIPVTTTLMGLGGFPGTHRLFIGMPGMHGSKVANYSLQQSDLIISVGARFDDRVTGHVASFAPLAKVVHIDIDPAAISKIIHVDVPVVGDAKQVLRELNKIVKNRSADAWNKKVMDWKGDKIFNYNQSETEIKPQWVVEELYRLTKGEAVISTEVGQNQMWAAQYYLFDKPNRLLTSGGLGTMGYGLPAAMGAAMGVKDRPVIDIAGDGSIQMNIQELATLALNNIPVKVVLLNNSYLGMVRQWQEMFYDKRYSSVSLTDKTSRGVNKTHAKEGDMYVPNFVTLANAYQIPAFRATKVSEVTDVLRQGLEVDGPAFMEFMISKEENVFPMVPAGKPIDQIVEG